MPTKGEAQLKAVSPHAFTTPPLSSAHVVESQQKDGKGVNSTENQGLKSGVRQIFGLGKQEESLQAGGSTGPTSANKMSQASSATNAMRFSSPAKRPANLEPTTQYSYGSNIASSPSRLRSTSPGFHSPASSEIFERNVQEPVQIHQLQGELSPAHIPSHVITEDHIPPALEASAQAITSGDLDPDEVEIVTSVSHQPAASGLEGSASHTDLTQLHAPFSTLQQHVRSDSPSLHHTSSGAQAGGEDDTASNYGQLDPTDVRRLSFISFADVVQSEHLGPTTSSLSETAAGGHRDSLYLSNVSAGGRQDRAASPLGSPHSPGSSGGLTTPPPGVVVNPAHPELSPGRSGLAGSVGGVQHGELQIETMRQAVRKTASGDLGVRSMGMSPVSDGDLSVRSRSRENS